MGAGRDSKRRVVHHQSAWGGQCGRRLDEARRPKQGGEVREGLRSEINGLSLELYFVGSLSVDCVSLRFSRSRVWRIAMVRSMSRTPKPSALQVQVGRISSRGLHWRFKSFGYYFGFGSVRFKSRLGDLTRTPLGKFGFVAGGSPFSLCLDRPGIQSPVRGGLLGIGRPIGSQIRFV